MYSCKFKFIYALVTPSLVELLSEEQGEDDEDKGDGDLQTPEGDRDVVEAVGAAVARQLVIDPARQNVHKGILTIHDGQVPRALHHMRR